MQARVEKCVCMKNVCVSVCDHAKKLIWRRKET